MRAGLGASRGRLQRQILVETLLLAVAGGAVAVVVARLSIGGLVSLAPASVARLNQAQLDPRVLLFMGAIVLIAVFVVRTDAGAGVCRNPARNRILQESGRGADESRAAAYSVRRPRRRRSGAGDRPARRQRPDGSRRWWGCSALIPASAPGNVLTFRVSLPREAYATREQNARTSTVGCFPELRVAAGRRRQSGSTTRLPFGGVITGTRMTAVGSAQSPSRELAVGEPGLFRAMTIPIHRGRTFGMREMVRCGDQRERGGRPWRNACGGIGIRSAGNWCSRAPPHR